MQLPGAVGAASARWLYSAHFLADRLLEWDEFRDIDAAGIHADLLALWNSERVALLAGANEGQTEERFIRPVLRILGHAFTLFAEIPGAGKTPDYFLYENDSVREAAETAGAAAKIERALAVADAKRFDRPLDRRTSEGDAVAQIRDYILLSRRPYGILTNGRIWRLYARDSLLVERATHEIDLVRLLEEGEPKDIRYFVAFFGAAALAPGPDGRTFLERALDDSALHAVEISGALERAVFAAVPPIAAGLLGDEPPTRESLDKAFANSLVFLYRVLFCLFAEARSLLPVENPDYRRYSIAGHRIEVASLLDEGRPLSTTSDALYAELGALFRLIERGDPGLAVTEYDGGLFEEAAHPWLAGRAVPDAALAPALDGIYRVGSELVDYRDLSVRALGTVYERLLAWELQEDSAALVLAESPRRHETGSYFTPEPVVDAIVERTLDPLVQRRSADVIARGLEGEAALDALLDLRVLDPAMGSGHFLVGAAEFLAQAIATDPSYAGDLSLDDLRRLVAERCLYGVDLNPLAVELARLSLWLVTARRGEPLSFLGNLRVGDSLVGADNETLLDPMTGLLEAHIAASAGELLRQVTEIQHRATHTAADAREKRRLAGQAEVLREAVGTFAEAAIQRFQPPPKAGRPRLHWPLEFPEVFVDDRGEPRADAGFDAVIGNPPYIRVQKIGQSMADYGRARFSTAAGAFDAYVLFLERGLALLGPRGRLGFIVPNKLFKLDYGARLRGKLAEGLLVEEVLDFGATQLFAGATNYTCILILDRGQNDDLDYRRLRGTSSEVLAELTCGGVFQAERFRTRNLGSDPWILVPPEEAAVIRRASEGSERLDAVTGEIFTGLQTSADNIYVLESRGLRGGNHVLWSRASQSEVELEPDLLHRLASGGDVHRYAFGVLPNVLLFPYIRQSEGMRLISADALSQLPLTHAYLRNHEEDLRQRESGRMDHAGWYGYVYPKSLGAHDSPKLGVPRLCERLRGAFDAGGVVYLDNVDVNGVGTMEGGVSAHELLALLNSRLLDWIFRRGSVPFQNNFWSANKQFIAGLPIKRADELPELAAIGVAAHRLASDVIKEKHDFLSWLAATVDVSQSKLPRRRRLEAYERLTDRDVVALLSAGRAALGVDPRERAIRQLIETEHRASVDRVAPLLSELATIETQADALVYQLYEIPADMQALVDAEYNT